MEPSFFQLLPAGLAPLIDGAFVGVLLLFFQQQSEFTMFERLKNAISTLSFAWKYGNLLRSFTTAWTNYPGLDSPDDLRTWIRPVLLDVSVLTTFTKTKIDDMIVLAAVRIVDSNHAWTAIHAMALMIRDGAGLDGTLIPSEADNAKQLMLLDNIARETTPECPILTHAAIGLLLYILQQRNR